MKKFIIPATLLAMMSVATVSCQKENLVEPSAPCVENSATRTIRYTVNGTIYRQVIHSDDDLDALMHTLFALAREGYNVRMMDESTSYSENSAKETLTFTTTNENEAIAWAKARTLEGYAVTTTFNQATNEYTCVAKK